MNFVDLQNFLREIIRRKSFVIFLSFAIVYKLIFNSFTGDFLFKYVFRNYSTGSFQGNVTKFSLFFGIEVRNLIIASGKDFDNKSIVEAERLSLSYNIPLLFLGRLRISEIAFIKPKINLLEKKGEWNVAKLFPAGKAEPRKEPEKESSGDEINLYVPVSAFLNFHLEDLDLSVEKEKGANFFNAKIEGFTFRFLVDTKRFRKIPLNTGAVSLLDKFEMKLNPDREIKVQFSDNSKSLKNPFRMTWILYQDSKVNPPVFYSKMDIGAKNVPIFVRNKILSPFGFSLYYDLNYIPKEDLLTLQDFKISFNEDVWLECKAKVHNALKSDRSLAFEITRSSIRLAPISKVLKDFPGMPSMNLDGVINLAPIRADGKFADLGVKGNIRIKDLVFQQGKSPAQKVKSLDFVFDMELDLVKNEKPSAANPFPYLKIVRIPKLEMNYNGFNISLKGEIATGRNIDLAVSFDKMKIAQYAPGQEGTVKGSVEIKAKNFAYLDTSSKIHVDSYKYTSGVSKSGAHNIDLYFKSGITFKENWALTEMPFEKLNLVLKNHNNAKAVTLDMSGIMNLANGFSIKCKNMNLETDLTNLLPTLPLSSREGIANMRGTYGNAIGAKGDLFYSIIKGDQIVTGNLVMSLPGLESRDFRMGFDVALLSDAKSTIKLNNFEFAAYNGILKGNIKGRLFKGDPEKPAPLGAFYPDMEIKLYIGSDKPQYMLKGISFSGAMDTQIKMNDFLVKGFIKFKDTNIISKSGTCPGDDCKIYFVNKLNLDFPFLHDLGARVTKELIEGDKTRFIRTYGQNHIPNFTIFQVVGPHPSIPGAPFEFVKNNGNTPGFSARMDYTENYFLLQNMKILILDGVIYGRDVLFNIGGGNSELMQYSATLQVKDIDLKQLLPAKSRHKIDDGKIKADMNLNGRNLSDPIGNLNLFFSVYQIGEDFGKSAMNVMSSQNIVMDYIYSSYNVEKMEIELSKGLVYASIFFKPSVLGAIVSIDDNKISQERMPLANFLKRARSEVSRYEK